MRDARERSRRAAFRTAIAAAILALAAAPRAAQPPFVERSAATGLAFVHRNGATGELLFPEVFGSGAAVFDYDGDGDLDVYLVQGGPLGEPAGSETGDRLFRNDIRPTDPESLRFQDVTAEVGIRATGYGMGVATADYDGDGDTDLYLTNLGRNQLWRNDGGRFTEVARSAGVDEDRWSVAAAFFDYDRDGLLDLYVGNYTTFRIAANKECRSPAGYRDYCSPESYDPEPDRLYRNRGDGTFEDVSRQAGLESLPGNGLGVLVGDLDGDSLLDLYVANDEMPNRLWINRGDGTFEDMALLSGAAVSGSGEPEASMGVDAADVDGDGDLDLFMTHYIHESNTLYVNDGSGIFDDRSAASGLGAPSWAFTGFGTAFLDFDNDGWLDVVSVNGAAIFIPQLLHAGDPRPLRQRNQLFRNLGQGRFEEITGEAGRAFELSEVSRGAAAGDLDNDGDLDLIVSNNDGAARLLINQVGQSRSWLGIELVNERGSSSTPGARLALHIEDGRILWRESQLAGSYASSRDGRVLFGLGDAGSVGDLLVKWPSGRSETFEGLSIHAYNRVVEGSGEPEPGR